MPTGMAIAVDKNNAIKARGKRNDDPLCDEIDHRDRIGVGTAEIQSEQTSHPIQIAPEKRLIEPHLLAKRLDSIFGRVHSQHETRRVAR